MTPDNNAALIAEIDVCATDVQAWRLMREARAALAAQPPREPTEAMITAASDAHRLAYCSCRDSVAAYWRAMYDAAPQPAAQTKAQAVTYSDPSKPWQPVAHPYEIGEEINRAHNETQPAAQTLCGWHGPTTRCAKCDPGHAPVGELAVAIARVENGGFAAKDYALLANIAAQSAVIKRKDEALTQALGAFEALRLVGADKHLPGFARCEQAVKDALL